MNVCIFTNHFASSRRWANIHWIAREMAGRGYRVTFLVTGLSAFTTLKKDVRSEYVTEANRNRLEEVSPHLFQYAMWSPFHPFNLKRSLANRLVSFLWRCYPRMVLTPAVTAMLREADLIIFESGLATMLIEPVAKMKLPARLIYRVSDDLPSLGCHPVVEETEKSYPSIDLISVLSSGYASRYPAARRLLVHRPTIAVDLFRQAQPSPFRADGKRRFLSIGSSFFDENLVLAIAEMFPADEVIVIGNIRLSRVPGNVRLMGEMAFAKLLPYLQHADVALAPYDAERITPGLAESSHKMTQFRFYGKPIITSEVLCAGSVSGIFGYAKNDLDSIRVAADSALAAIGHVPKVEPPETWASVVDDLVSVGGDKAG